MKLSRTNNWHHQWFTWWKLKKRKPIYLFQPRNKPKLNPSKNPRDIIRKKKGSIKRKKEREYLFGFKLGQVSILKHHLCKHSRKQNRDKEKQKTTNKTQILKLSFLCVTQKTSLGFNSYATTGITVASSLYRKEHDGLITEESLSRKALLLLLIFVFFPIKITRNIWEKIWWGCPQVSRGIVVVKSSALINNNYLVFFFLI